MKKLAIALVLILLLASSVFAQPEAYYAGIFIDQAGAICGWPAAFAPFSFYALAFDLDGQLKGYEFGVTYQPPVTIISSTPNPPTALNLGPAPTNWIVGTGLCMPDLPGQWFVMVTFTGLLFAPPVDLLICMTAATPSSFEPPSPGYLRCDGTLQRLRYAETDHPSLDGCMLLYPTFMCPVATESTSWGSVKARF